LHTIKLNNKDDYRIIAISDVHGHKIHLDELLKKVELKDDDILIILGDFINRGRNSFETYEYVKELSTRKNTYILKGNHEYFIHHGLRDKKRINELHKFLKQEYYETIVHSVLDKSEHSIHSLTAEELMDYFTEHHALDFFSGLPIFLEIDDHIFVHGGYDESFLEEGRFLKYDHYNELSGVNKKKIVVGHWPTCNLRYHELSNIPFFNHEKNIVFIDGGLGIKITGELNAFIIEKKDGCIKYDYVQYNDFSKGVIVKRHSFDHEPLIYVNYPHYQFELIKRGQSMSLCRHEYSGIEFHVFNGLLKETDEGVELVTNYINRFLDLNVGDEVLICESYEDCTLVKYKDEFGWVLTEQVGKL
jgi:predicted phosphodiesterase